MRFISRFLVFVFRMALAFPLTRKWAVSRLGSWTSQKTSQRRNWVAWLLQEKISQVTGFPTCDYCYWIEFPSDPHEYCRGKLAQSEDYELDADRQEFVEDREDEAIYAHN